MAAGGAAAAGTTVFLVVLARYPRKRVGSLSTLETDLPVSFTTRPEF